MSFTAITRRSSPPPIPVLLSSSLSSDLRCNECGSDDILEDHREGVIVCKQCGVVLSSQLISEEPEWRTFQDDDDNGHSLNQTIVSRAGSEDETLSTFRGLSTITRFKKRKRPSSSFITRSSSEPVHVPIPTRIESPPSPEHYIEQDPEEQEEEQKGDQPTRGVQSLVDKGTLVIQDGGKTIRSSPAQISMATSILTRYISDQLQHNSKIRIKYREVSMAALWISSGTKTSPIEPFIQYLDRTLNPRTTENVQFWKDSIVEWLRLNNKQKTG
jgi:TFIIB zinc-binding